MLVDIWSEFYYDETSPTFLRWAIEIRSGFKNSTVLRQVGDVAGSPGRNHFRVKLRGKAYRVHKIIYEKRYGPLPPGVLLDHEDGNWQNNRIGNLRIGGSSLNNRNTKASKPNSSGTTGVCYDAAWKVWRAYCSDHITGNRRTKCFSIAKFGLAAKSMAQAWRAAAMADMNEAGAGYTARHGHRP